MSGQPCDICYRWFTEPYHKHMERHFRENPHVFCKTMRCDNGPDCPVKQTKQS